MILAVKFVPLLVRNFCRQPCLKIICCNKNLAVTLAVLFGEANASTHLVSLSMAIDRKRFPTLLVGNGPTMSILTV